MKINYWYVFFILFCILISLSVYRTVEASVLDWLLGGTKTVEIVFEPEIKYNLGDKIPDVVINEIIAKHATGTKAYQMKRTLGCESGFYNIQSNIVKNGIREDSWGIAQIHLPSHPNVTKEQALDPEFAIKFMSDNWGKVAWYGYIAKNDSCNIIYK